MTLSMMQWYAIATEHGYKCPYCGKFRKLEDFEDQPGHVNFGDDRVRVHLHVAPGCKKCMEEGERQ